MRANEIPIASPCGADWRAMKPSDTKRFCAECQKHVHDLSAMTPERARALLASPPAEGLCVRYLYDAHGAVVFRDAPLPAGMLVRAKRLAKAAAAVTLPLAFAACSSAVTEVPQHTMGVIACPMPPPPAPTASASAVVYEKMGEPPAPTPEKKK